MPTRTHEVAQNSFYFLEHVLDLFCEIAAAENNRMKETGRKEERR